MTERTIIFDTVTDQDRKETGVFDEETQVLQTQSEARPNFKVHDDGSVTLISVAESQTRRIENFGENCTIQ